MLSFQKSIVFLFLILFLASCSRNAHYSKRSQFNIDQQRLILAAPPSEPMRVFKITNKSDSILLRQICDKVNPIKDKKIIDQFIARLYATVRDSMSLGVGIAAPQVGLLKQIIWIQRFDKEGLPFEVYLNPIIKQYSKKTQPCPEGCLSIPDRMETLNNRSYAILIEYDDQQGKHHTEMVEDFTAVVFQHEIDHLNGILFIDHLQKELKQ